LSDGEVPSRALFESVEAMGDPSTPPSASGYKPIRLLGAGSSGVVWLAEQRRPFVRPVALKVFHGIGGSQRVLEVFRSERDILARLPRSGFCDIFDAGLCEDGRPYLAMEYVDGEHLLDAARTLRDASALAAMFVDLSRVIGQAHAIDLVHLDLKPSNILVERAGGRCTRVIDFGLGGTAGAHSAGRGSRGYAAPEVQRGSVVSKAADVYSLAAMLLEALRQRNDLGRTGLGRRLASQAARNMAEDPTRRSADATKFAEAIAGEVASMQRRRLLGYAVAAGATIAAGGGCFAWLRHRRLNPPPYVPIERHVPRDYPTIQAAVDAARPGDVVRIAPGVYRGRVEMHDKSVSLRGVPGLAASTVLDAQGTELATIDIFKGDPARSSVCDLTITHSGVAGTNACGIRFDGDASVPLRVERCIIRDNIARGDGTPGGANFIGSAILDACAFIGNAPGYRGAAFSVYDGCTVEAIDCSFRDHFEGSAMIAAREDALVRLDGCVIVGTSRLTTARRDSHIVFRQCRGSNIRIAGGTGFIDGGGNCWECVVDEDCDGLPDLEAAIMGQDPASGTH
jgi:serine/threonine protein kinase